MSFAFCRAVTMRGMSTSCAMMPGTAVKSAPDRKAENGKLEPDRPASTKRTAPQTRPPRGWRRSWAGCASPGGRASRTQHRKLPAQKPSKWRWGTSGASRRAPSGAAGPQSPPPDPTVRPARSRRAGWGNASGRAYCLPAADGPSPWAARRPAPERVRPARHCGPEKSFWFSSVSSCDCAAEKQKRGLPVGLQANGRPLHGVCFKNAAAENSARRASARRPGFLPEIVKIIAECRRICQDRPRTGCKLTKKESVWSSF